MARRTRKNTARKSYNNTPKVDPYERVTNAIVERLESGELPPWRKSWSGAGCAGIPVSVSSRKAYRGINVFLLAMVQLAAGYASRYWLTYRKAQELGGHVRKGEKGTAVVAWRVSKWTEDRTDANGNTEQVERQALRAYCHTVFNVDQCDGVELPASLVEEVEAATNNDDPIESAEAIVRGYLDRDGAPALAVGQPSYSPALDTVRMPAFERFDGAPEYYSTMYHELGHSTGAKTRLDRGFSESVTFGDNDYSKEELVAEFTAAFLCAEAGIEMGVLDNQAAYIKGWLSKLRDDKRLAVNAAQAAQKAADLILGR